MFQPDLFDASDLPLVMMGKASNPRSRKHWHLIVPSKAKPNVSLLLCNKYTSARSLQRHPPSDLTCPNCRIFVWARVRRFLKTHKWEDTTLEGLLVFRDYLEEHGLCEHLDHLAVAAWLAKERLLNQGETDASQNDQETVV